MYISYKNFNNLNDFKTNFPKIFQYDVWGKVELSNLYLRVSEGQFCLEENSKVKKSWALNKLAFPTIKDRARNNAPIQRMMNDESVCSFLNISWPYLKEKGLYLERNGKLLAVHSDKYVILEQTKIIQKLFEKTNYVGLEFDCATYTDELTSILFSFAERERKMLLEGIRGSWESLGGDTKMEIEPKIMFATSDIGEQAATIYPIITSKGKDYIVGEPLKQKHYGEVTIEKVIDMLDKAFILAKNATARVCELNEIVLNNPIGVMEKVSEAASLSRKEVKKLVDGFLLMYDEDISVTAYDVFIALASIEMKTDSIIAKLTQREKLARILYLDWKKMDDKLTFDKSKYIHQMKIKEVI